MRAQALPHISARGVGALIMGVLKSDVLNYLCLLAANLRSRIVAKEFRRGLPFKLPFGRTFPKWYSESSLS